MRNDYAVFIITHGRPNNQKTYNLLKSMGFKGKIFLIVDNLDKTKPEYEMKYKDKVIVFDKPTCAKNTDTGLVEPFLNFAVFARNAVEDCAKVLGYKYFMVFDDDIRNLRIRYDYKGSLKSRKLDGIINEVFDACIDFMESTNIQCSSLGFCNVYRQGVSALYENNPRNRLCAEAFIRNAEQPVDWRLNMLEDLITSLDYNMWGNVWMQLLPIQVEIVMSEGKVEGGNSDAYNNLNQFEMNFLPVVAHPECCKVRFTDKWSVTTHAKDISPAIISEKYKKE